MLQRLGVLLETRAVRTVLVGLIILSLLPFDTIEQTFRWAFLIVFGGELLIRVQLLLAPQREAPAGRAEMLFVLFDVAAFISFLPLQAWLPEQFEALRILRLARLLVLLRFAREQASDLYSILTRREQLHQFALVSLVVAALAFVSAVLLNELGISHEEAASFIEAYFARYPKVRAYLDGQVAQARRDGFVQTLLGRKRFIPEVNNPDPNVRQFGERMAINAPIQGTAADLMKMAMVRLAEQLRERGLKSRMILQVHDELVFEAPPTEQPTLVRLVRDVMEHVVALAVPLTVTIKAGPNWRELSPVENP
jgi:hypothetical protein